MCYNLVVEKELFWNVYYMHLKLDDFKASKLERKGKEVIQC